MRATEMPGLGPCCLLRVGSLESFLSMIRASEIASAGRLEHLWKQDANVTNAEPRRPNYQV